MESKRRLIALAAATVVLAMGFASETVAEPAPLTPPAASTASIQIYLPELRRLKRKADWAGLERLSRQALSAVQATSGSETAEPAAADVWLGEALNQEGRYSEAEPLLRQALANRPLTVFGDGSQTRSFCYVSDLIRGLIALAESGHHEPVNIGNPDEFTLLELAETIRDLTGASSEIVYEALPEDDPKQRKPDITLARELLGWSPEVTLREGLKRTIDASGAKVLIG